MFVGVLEFLCACFHALSSPQQTKREYDERSKAWEVERAKLVERAQMQAEKSHDDLFSQQEMFREKIRTLEVSFRSVCTSSLNWEVHCCLVAFGVCVHMNMYICACVHVAGALNSKTG